MSDGLNHMQLVPFPFPALLTSRYGWQLLPNLHLHMLQGAIHLNDHSTFKRELGWILVNVK